MSRKTTIAVGLMLVLAQVGLAAVDPSLVGWWRLDEGGGTVAIDSSGTGNNGELMGGPQYVDGVLRGALEFNGTDQFVEIPHDPSLNVDTEVTVMCWFNAGRAGGGTGDNWQGLIAKSNGPRSYSLYTRVNNVFHFSVGPGGAFVGSSSSGTFALNEWTHVAAQVVGGQHQYWVNGEDAGTGGAGTVLPGAADTGPVYIGRTAEGLAGRAFLGMIDDARIYNRALSQEEIKEAMKGNLFPIAESPFPQDESPDVVRDVDLAWTAGEFAQTHNVYLGAAWDDVNAASTDTPLGVLASAGQSADTFDPGRLGFSETYYWRVDEVNAAPDSTVFKGDVWSFTVEPFSIPIDNITATAASSFGASVAEKTIDGSGMAGDLHGTSAGDMWISGGIPATIDYAFDRAYKLHEMWIWNSNQLIEAFVGFGAKDVVIEHSLDGENWTVLDGVGPLAQATGTEGYAHNSTVNFGGVMAQHVRLTVNSVQGIAPQASLSEVRFYYIPVSAREPQPADGVTIAGLDATLSWRSGREAGSHEVYLDMDTATTLVATVDENSYLATALELESTYQWKIDEVNDVESPAVHEGNVWSFSTPASLSVDDMEIYADEEFLEIWATWVDGFDDPANGSLVGNGAAGTPETGIVHGGSQSLPLNFDNRGAQASEATRTFDQTQNWTQSGIQSLVLFLNRGADNTGGQVYVKINDTKIVFEGGADLPPGWDAWTQWTIDLSAVADAASVRSLTIGVEGAGATGVLYVDSIQLFKNAPVPFQPLSWFEAEAADVMGASWKLVADPTASGGNRIGSEDGDGDDNDTAPGAAWVASYTITVPADGVYGLSLRAQEATSDSFWVRIVGATSQSHEDPDQVGTGWVRFNEIDAPSGWAWDEVHSNDHGNAVVTWTLPAGTLTLEIAKREDGTYLDAIVLMN